MTPGLKALVEGRDDEQLVAAMKALGGVEPILRQAMDAVRASVAATSPDATLGFALRCDGLVHDYTLLVRRGHARLEHRSPYDAPITLILTGQDFLRLLAKELDWVECFMNNRITYKGDIEYLKGIQGMFGPPPQLSPET